MIIVRHDKRPGVWSVNLPYPSYESHKYVEEMNAGEDIRPIHVYS